MSTTKTIYENLCIESGELFDEISTRLIFIMKNLKRRGVIVAISGGIDSSVTLAIAVRVLGAERVLALQMPERHSAEETLYLSNLLVDTFGVEKILEEITGPLEAVGFYRRYEDAVRSVIADYDEHWKSKIVISNVVENPGYTFFYIVAETPTGKIIKKRLPLKAYLEIVSATNFKQRIRKMFEYYHADRISYATTATPNRLEYDQGFFVKLGDGAGDVKPIAHLYKTQVYQLADYLGVPKEICKRAPTTDTYSMPQSQEEFYFSLPYDKMDICLYGKNNGYSATEVSEQTGLTEQQVLRVYNDIETKRATTQYLHLPPQLIGNIPEISTTANG